MSEAHAKAFIEKWVLARQAIERLPAWPNDENSLYDAVVKQAPLWLEANTHEVTFERLGREQAWEHEDFELAFNEVGVPAHMRQAFARRQANRSADYFIHLVQGCPTHVTTWFIPFGFFVTAEAIQTGAPQMTEGLNVSQLEELFTHLNPIIRLLELVNDQQNIAPKSSFMNVRLLEQMGWEKNPFCLWEQQAMLSRLFFQTDPVQGGLLSLSLVAESKEALGVLEDMMDVIMRHLVTEGLGFYKYMGVLAPREEAYEESMIGLSQLWAKMVFCASGSCRGNVEFFFTKGEPNRLQVSVRLRDNHGAVNGLLTHSVSFQEPSSLGRILAPWMAPQASHLAWQFSSAMGASYSDERLSSSRPFW